MLPGWAPIVARVAPNLAPMSEPCRVEIGDGCIYYQVGGVGPPVMLVHGLSGSSRWWARNVSVLAAHFRVYVVDLIGFGGSRGRQRFVLDEAADYLVKLLDEVGVDRVGLVGHSMGGFIAASLAADYSDRVDRLVLVDAAALPLGPRRGRAIGLARAVRRLPISFLPILATDALRAGPVTIVRAAQELLTTDISAKLARVQAPTLVVWGERDALIPLEVGERLAAAVPDGRLEIVERAGHNPMWDQPAAFNRLVVEFLAP